MSSGVYALLGVLLGGLVTAGVTWSQGWRAARVEWLTASRLISHEVEQLILGLRDLIAGGVPSYMPETFMASPLWDEYRSAIARGLKNDDEGDEFWRGLSRFYATVRETEQAIKAGNPGPIEPATAEWLRGQFNAGRRAYESLTGAESKVHLHLSPQAPPDSSGAYVASTCRSPTNGDSSSSSNGTTSTTRKRRPASSDRGATFFGPRPAATPSRQSTPIASP